eukprot:CAMPEP_0168793738 /NCGR_PEP_ID=MMETSP0725-20121227/15246_1 /TAXON_ID=265536 /ORGANISM="Amphiprora sp., Strain CCMP467" /LENGTH=346 /DNA_ID=CAMNT_0008844535 /DNA_START=23 /DNA_END=1065 /DNA_ORIENTATION=-
MAPRKKMIDATYMVSYDSANHCGVVFQMWGSVWPKVLPYCIFNVLVMMGLGYLKEVKASNLKMQTSAQGHGFITVVVAFLVVSRVNIALGASLTTEEAQQWRHELAYRTLLMLRTTMVVIDYPTDFVAAWDIPELQGEERSLVKNGLTGPLRSRWSHSRRGEWEETMRVPIRLAYLVRKALHSNTTRLRVPLAIPQELKLLGCVDTFMSGYYGVRKFLTTPVPFPLIQMARTFLFLYIFTVPMVLVTDETYLQSRGPMPDCIHDHFWFYGARARGDEMDNPFGDDANDFNNAAMAMTAYEDSYLTIYDVDGEEWADKLRRKMDDGKTKTNFFDDDESSWLLKPQGV